MNRKQIHRVILVVIGVWMLAHAAHAIQEKDIDRTPSQALGAALDEIAGPLGIGKVKTTRYKGLTWQVKMVGSLSVLLFVSGGVLVMKRRRKRAPGLKRYSYYAQQQEKNDEDMQPFRL